MASRLHLALATMVLALGIITVPSAVGASPVSPGAISTTTSPCPIADRASSPGAEFTALEDLVDPSAAQADDGASQVGRRESSTASPTRAGVVQLHTAHGQATVDAGRLRIRDSTEGAERSIAA